jgi:hypothetical protein
MQQQREQGQNIEKIKPRERLVLQYNKRFFWTARYLMVLALCVQIVISVFYFISKNYILSKVTSALFSLFSAPLIIFGSRILFQKSRQEEQWVREHGDEILILDDAGIVWQSGEKTIHIHWNEIVHSYQEDGVYVLVKQGVEEEEIRFRDIPYCLSDAYQKRFSLLPKSIVPTIERYCPFLQQNAWVSTDEETISVKPSQANYQIANGKIFSYHTKNNNILNIISSITYLLFSAMFTISALTILARKVQLYSPLQVSLIILCFAVAAIKYWYSRRWYQNSQIETDDLGIALVEPKGVTWRALWFTIADYRTDEKYMTLIAKDGRPYKFPLNTARKDELEVEVQRRIGVGGTE